jgi:hypothetical protein
MVPDLRWSSSDTLISPALVLLRARVASFRKHYNPGREKGT